MRNEKIIRRVGRSGKYWKKQEAMKFKLKTLEN